MGTPPSSDLRARSKRALDLGRPSTNFCCSRVMREWSFSRFMIESFNCIHSAKLKVEMYTLPQRLKPLQNLALIAGLKPCAAQKQHQQSSGENLKGLCYRAGRGRLPPRARRNSQYVAR